MKFNKILVLASILSFCTFSSCKNNKVDKYSGRWECSNHDGYIIFKLVAKNTYSIESYNMKAGGNQKRTGTLNENGVLDLGYGTLLPIVNNEIPTVGNWGLTYSCGTLKKVKQ